MPDPNAPECDCRWLENAAEDPHVPITFDSKLNEYHLIRGGELGGTMLFYHCPFCGGRAPKSRRDALFLHVTHEEMLRLDTLTRNLKSLADVVAAFGNPDEDYPTGHGVTKPGAVGEPDKTEHYRSIRYNNLSQTAVVDVIVHPLDRVHFTSYGKPAEPHEG